MKAKGCPRFGAPSSLANTILAFMSLDDSKRAAITLRHGTDTITALEKISHRVSSYNSKEKSIEVKNGDDASMVWEVNQALKRAGKIPDGIYDSGDREKAAIVTLVDESAEKIAIAILNLSKLI